MFTATTPAQRFALSNSQTVTVPVGATAVRILAQGTLYVAANAASAKASDMPVRDGVEYFGVTAGQSLSLYGYGAIAELTFGTSTSSGGGGFPTPPTGYQWALVGTDGVEIATDLGPVAPATPVFGDVEGYNALLQANFTQPIILVVSGQIFSGIPTTGTTGPSTTVTITTAGGLISAVDIT